jgi:LuxR family maltose regulon positive regulatory protein
MEALAAVDQYRMYDYVISPLAFAVAARLAVHRGDLKEADRQLTAGMRARPTCTFVLPWLAVRTRLQLAKVYWASGDHASPRHLLREIDDILLQRPALGTLVDEDRLRGSSHRAHHGERPEAPLSPAELRLLPYLQTLTLARSASGSSSLATLSVLKSPDLSEAERLLTQGCGATCDGYRSARRVARSLN